MCIPFRRWYRTISLVHPVCIIYNIRIYIIILYYIVLYYIIYYILYIIYYLLYIIYYILYMTGYGSHANSNGLPSFSLFKLLFVGIPYFQTHGSHYISMIGTVFVQCFSPGLKKNSLMLGKLEERLRQSNFKDFFHNSHPFFIWRTTIRVFFHVFPTGSSW